ncbi:MAG: PTS sugar transporter subunit IIA [Elusimicrobia bacterium]|nr:PTS sugar transporter subunit IIA [Elusimicrobiota bacterium]
MKIIIAAHGEIAGHLKEAVENLVGRTDKLYAVDFRLSSSPAELRNSMKEIVDIPPADEEVFILTDFFGGSPCNCACWFLDRDNVWIVSGVNLPMLIELMVKKNKVPPARLCEEIIKAAKDSIVDVKKKFDKCDIDAKKTDD